MSAKIYSILEACPWVGFYSVLVTVVVIGYTVVEPVTTVVETVVLVVAVAVTVTECVHIPRTDEQN
jgi:hypothetical protein